MKIKGVDFVLYKVSDLKRALTFYEGVLGLELGEEYGGYRAEFAAGKTTFAVSSKGPIAQGGATVAFAVDDVIKSVQQLKSKKVKVIEEPRETGMCFRATIADQDGNEIILHQRKDGTIG